MIWYREELHIASMPKGESAVLEARLKEGHLSIVAIFQEAESTHEAELWSKTVKSSLQPYAEYSGEDVFETYGHKVEKEKEKLERLSYDGWITHLASHLDDIDKAKDLLKDKDII
jgi:hypothetical protein